jgi:hypothetical protein
MSHDIVRTVADESMRSTVDDYELGAWEQAGQPMAHCEWTDWIGVAPKQENGKRKFRQLIRQVLAPEAPGRKRSVAARESVIGERQGLLGRAHCSHRQHEQHGEHRSLPGHRNASSIPC